MTRSIIGIRLWSEVVEDKDVSVEHFERNTVESSEPRAEGAGLPPTEEGRRTRILLVSGWQTVNIGDVAHSPGALRAFERYAGDVEVVLWAISLDERERRMLAQEFPHVRVVEGRLAEDGTPPPHLLEEFDAADLLLHGSGPGPVAWRLLAAWRDHTDKPCGFFGVTIDPLMPHTGTLAESALMVDALGGPVLEEPVRRVIEEAAFVYCRESLSLRALDAQGLAGGERRAFGPDVTLACDLVDPQAGAAVMDRYDLVEGEFLCVVPRVRHTPYYRLRDYPPKASDWRKEAYNAAHVEADMAVLRTVIVDYVRSTGHQVLVGPEMSHAVDLAQEAFTAEALPADVAPSVHVLPHFWSLPEAAAVYRHTSAVVSMECHSPLIATALGVPAFYIRQPTETVKGQMYADLGMGEHIFEISPDPSPRVIEALSKLVADPALARAQAATFRDQAHERLRSMVRHVVDTARLRAPQPLTRGR